MVMTRHRLVYPFLLLVLLFTNTCRDREGDEKRAAAVSSTGLSVSRSSLAGPSLVEVEFRGIISHVTSGNIHRAVLVSDSAHTPLLTMPISYRAQLEALFPGKVIDGDRSDECSLKIRGMTLRIVGTDGLPPVNRLQQVDFGNPPVPHLKAMYVDPLHDDVINAFPATTDRVAAWFDLNGGEALPTKFKKCLGRFDNNPNYQEFNKFVALTMFTSTRAQLRVHTSANTEVVLPLGATRVQMRISNNPLDPNELKKPHFHLFKYLAKDPPNNFPNVIPAGDCVAEIGTVAGCSNSAWP